MLPRRSFRFRQMSGQNVSTSVSSSSGDGTSKSTVKKRTRLEPSSDMEDADQPKQKEMKFGNLDNLELLPVEILEKIFVKTDDIALLQLANTCTRFEAIAQTVFSKKYADNYFLINGEELQGDPEMYTELFNRFGNSIKAIQLSHIRDIDSTHWTAKILQPHINQTKKLMFNKCNFKSNYILSQRMDNITHLAIRGVSFESNDKIDLPKCQNLIDLEICRTYGFTYSSLQQTIRNNPTLQRVVLRDFYNFKYGKKCFKLINLIAVHLSDIKELVLINNYVSTHDLPVSVTAIDSIVNTFKRLESLSIAVPESLVELLQRMAKQCNSLKHLGWFQYGNDIGNETIRSFKQIECLHLMCAADVFTACVEHLPNLRHLIIDQYLNEFSSVLPLLYKCQSLQQITVVFKYDPYPKDFITVEFFDKFIETMAITGKSNARIDLKMCDQIIGSATADGIIWRNKLMHWMNCDKNDTNIHLLDLANRFDTSDGVKSADDQTCLLDKIFDYLDLGSLTVFAEINERSKRLVNTYVKKHVKKQETFIITEEFDLKKYFNDYDICFFVDTLKYARSITNLNVFILNSFTFMMKIIENCERLVKLSIYDKNPHNYWPTVQTELSHIVYDSPQSIGYWKLIQIIECFAKVEIIECKNVGLFNDLKSVKKHTQTFGGLKKFIFNYRGETQMKNLKKIFENTTVQLVPIS